MKSKRSEEKKKKQKTKDEKAQVSTNFQLFNILNLGEVLQLGEGGYNGVKGEGCR